MGYLIATAFWVFAIWLIRKDSARREGISIALWIPTLWAFILLSRPVSFWLGSGGGVDSMEGSPVDRLFYFGMIALALITLARRQVNWVEIAVQNWPIILFYGFFLFSVLWADSSVVSFKRWFKDFGNVSVALVILTEKKPMEAFRAVFVRCGYILIPLSVIFLRYFPELGRRYSRSGGLEVTGVTTQKNSLGIMVVICGLILLWDWYERSPRKGQIREGVNRYFPPMMVVMGVYLLYLCDSQTSILCMLLGAAIISAVKVPALRRRIGAFGGYFLVLIAFYMFLDWIFGLNTAILTLMGRDMTFTGRTDVWRELLALKTDPIIGTGFCSFWSDMYYQSQLPYWVGASAHNGYLETYIDGGFIGLFFLAILLTAVAFRVNKRLGTAGSYALVQFAVLIVILVGSFSESHFGRMGPLWFIFLLSALELPRRMGSLDYELKASTPHEENLPQTLHAGSWLPTQ